MFLKNIAEEMQEKMKYLKSMFKKKESRKI